MNYFNERILLWQPFFITMATVAGTLVGLLFISISINGNSAVFKSHPDLFRLAQRSFSDFICVLLIALFFLIPLQSGCTLGIEMIVTGIFRFRLTLAQIKSTTHKPKTRGITLLREYGLPIVATTGLIIGAVWLCKENIQAVYYGVVPVIGILLVNASSNAWQLLIMKKG